jgi:ssDNA-binding Zn-finger/Zn-ribbon topoisomerase 1
VSDQPANTPTPSADAPICARCEKPIAEPGAKRCPICGGRYIRTADGKLAVLSTTPPTPTIDETQRFMRSATRVKGEGFSAAGLTRASALALVIIGSSGLLFVSLMSLMGLMSPWWLVGFAATSLLTHALPFVVFAAMLTLGIVLLVRSGRNVERALPRNTRPCPHCNYLRPVPFKGRCTECGRIASAMADDAYRCPECRRDLRGLRVDHCPECHADVRDVTDAPDSIDDAGAPDDPGSSNR